MTNDPARLSASAKRVHKFNGNRTVVYYTSPDAGVSASCRCYSYDEVEKFLYSPEKRKLLRIAVGSMVEYISHTYECEMATCYVYIDNMSLLETDKTTRSWQYGVYGDEHQPVIKVENENEVNHILDLTIFFDSVHARKDDNRLDLTVEISNKDNGTATIWDMNGCIDFDEVRKIVFRNFGLSYSGSTDGDDMSVFILRNTKRKRMPKSS